MKKTFSLLLSSLLSVGVGAHQLEPLHTLEAQTSAVNSSQQPHNVLLLLIDDLGWTDLGAYGSQYHESPNIDALASKSRLYTQAYASSPVCSPTRAALLTGKHPSRLKITTHFPGHKEKTPKLQEPWKTDHLALSEFTLAEAFQSRGYSTFFAGKWHLGGEGKLPTDQGFDINIGGFNKGSPRGGYYDPYKNPNLPNRTPGEHLTKRLTDETIDFLKQDHNEPFFALLSYYAVHTPLEAGPDKHEYFEKKANKVAGAKAFLIDTDHDSRTQLNQVDAKYASMIWAVDKSVGRILAALEQQGLDKNTLVVLTSDNGGFSTRKQGDTRVTATANLPLRSGKGWIYEGGIRIPLLIHQPGQQIQSQHDTLTTTVDLYPTLTAVAGAKTAKNIDGTDLLMLDNNPDIARQRPVVWHHPHYHGSGNTPSEAIRVGDWKLLHFYEHDTVELYNLKQDIAEQVNLADSEPEKKRQLLNLLDEWYTDNDIERVSLIE
ncbi:sulfatase [Shewanella sp. D64]|uniref:sulfatase n=1 Tax=unclassified Shewanella TaxID=196818 RepID=UPI0022BA4C2A|nr:MULTISPECIES: sulfatase [unclassified Shewanella]MEC4724563.1 sulfatase [Shewanella sp. D64]MEC4736660.1 sulfatase [Shewanella sp. E94]WBJ94670.1 sulfatase [Shewanella sp. MTB7]